MEEREKDKNNVYHKVVSEENRGKGREMRHW